MSREALISSGLKEVILACDAVHSADEHDTEVSVEEAGASTRASVDLATHGELAAFKAHLGKEAHVKQGNGKTSNQSRPSLPSEQGGAGSDQR